MVVFVPFIATTITPYIMTNTVDDPQCLGVLAEFLDRGIFIDTTSLSLAVKEFFQWVLADPFTEKTFHSR